MVCLKYLKEYDRYVSTNGNIYRLDRSGKNLIPCKKQISRKGYEMIWANDNYVLVHRLVALAYIDNPLEKPCIDHIDRNKTNNNVENLRCVTYRENNRNTKANDRCKAKYGVNTYEDGVAYSKARHKIYDKHRRDLLKAYRIIYLAQIGEKVA